MYPGKKSRRNLEGTPKRTTEVMLSGIKKEISKRTPGKFQKELLDESLKQLPTKFLEKS